MNGYKFIILDSIDFSLLNNSFHIFAKNNEVVTQVQPRFLYSHNQIPTQTGMSVCLKKFELLLRNSFFLRHARSWCFVTSLQSLNYNRFMTFYF